MTILFAALALTTDLFIVDRAMTGIHLFDPSRPSVPVTYVNGVRVDGAPGRARCGVVPFVRVNDRSAASLYPNLVECDACRKAAEAFAS